MAKKGSPNKRLRIERRRRGWTQEDVVNLIHATASGRDMAEPKSLSANYVSRWERGIVQPDPYHSLLLGLTFDLPPEQLGLGMQDARQEEATNRREFTISTASVLAATVTDVALGWLNSELWDSLLARRTTGRLSTDAIDYFLEVIDRCWGLLNAGDMSTADHVLTSALPAFMRRADQQPGASLVVAQGLRLLSVIRGHDLKLAERVTLCQQAVEYARRSGDPNALAASLTELAVSFKYAGQPENSFATYVATLPHADKARPLVCSRVYAAAAAAFAQRGVMRQFERYASLASEALPPSPESEPFYLTADYGFHLLAFYEGVAQLSLGRPAAALTAFERFMQSPLALRAPVRNRLEIVNQKGRAAIMAGDLEQYAAQLEEGVFGALAVGSRKRFDEAINIYRDHAPVEWRRDARIRAIIDRPERGDVHHFDE